MAIQACLNAKPCKDSHLGIELWNVISVVAQKQLWSRGRKIAHVLNLKGFAITWEMLWNILQSGKTECKGRLSMCPAMSIRQNTTEGHTRSCEQFSSLGLRELKGCTRINSSKDQKAWLQQGSWIYSHRAWRSPRNQSCHLPRGPSIVWAAWHCCTLRQV